MRKPSEASFGLTLMRAAQASCFFTNIFHRPKRDLYEHFFWQLQLCNWRRWVCCMNYYRSVGYCRQNAGKS